MSAVGNVRVGDAMKQVYTLRRRRRFTDLWLHRRIVLKGTVTKIWTDEDGETWIKVNND